MNETDIEFTVGLDLSPAEQQLENLYKDSVIAQGRLNKILSGNMSEQTYLSKLEKFERLQNRVGTDTSSMSNADYNRYIKLRNDIGRYERNIKNFSESVNKVFSQVGAYNAAQGNSDFHPGLYQALFEQKRNQDIDSILTERNKTAAQGAFEVFQSITTPNGILALPAPEQTESGFSKFKRKAGSFFEPKSKLATDTYQNIDEISELITDEAKKQGREYDNNLLKLGKILSILYLIRRAISTAVKLWQGFDKITTEGNQNLNKQRGFFTQDPTGALSSNYDLTRPRLYEGIRNWGANAPISANALDTMAEKWTGIWSAAVSGRQVDKQTAIDIERLHRYAGLDMTPQALLTGARNGKSITDMQVDAINKIEKYLSSSEYAGLNDIERGQLVDSIVNVFGSELVNGIVANIQKNKVMSEEYQQTVIDKILSKSDTALVSGNYTENITRATNVVAEFKESLSKLSQSIVNNYTPEFEKATNKIRSITEWIDAKINKDKTSEPKTTGGKVIDANTMAAFENDYAYQVYYKGIRASLPKSSLYNILKSSGAIKFLTEWGKQFTWNTDYQKEFDASSRADFNDLSYEEAQKRARAALYSKDPLERLSFSLYNSPDAYYGIGRKLEAQSMQNQWNILDVMWSSKDKSIDWSKHSSPLVRKVNELGVSGILAILENEAKTAGSPLSYNGGGLNPLIRKYLNGEELSQYQVNDVLGMLRQSGLFSALFFEMYKEGGAMDFTSATNPAAYMLNPWNYINENDYKIGAQKFIESLLAAQEQFGFASGLSKVIKVDDQEITVKIQLVDEKGKLIKEADSYKIINNFK